MADLAVITLFKGGKLSVDARQAKAEALATVRGQAVGLEPDDYEIVLVPAGTLVPLGETMAKLCVAAPPKGKVNNVTILVHVSNAGRPSIAEKE